jgi:DeoR/GlpR family transcriptional regulator of sugar metabolism
MDVSERRSSIEERVIRTGEVQFAELAQEFGVSEMTIRRDIETLQNAGVVRRISGGAIAVGGTAFEPSYGARAGRAVDSKAHIAHAVVELLSPGETVILDSGSTVASVARALCGRGLGLTVVTPSLTVATTLADEPDTTVILAGGMVRPGELSLIGPEAERVLSSYNCDTYIAGVAGVDGLRGLTEYHPQEAAVKRAAVASARRVVVGADASKLGRVHLVNIAPLSAVEVLVTDAEPTHPTVLDAQAAGAEAVLVTRPSS